MPEEGVVAAACGRENDERGERSRALDILEQAWGERPVPPRDA